jgi:hypothetical protein
MPLLSRRNLTRPLTGHPGAASAQLGPLDGPRRGNPATRPTVVSRAWLDVAAGATGQFHSPSAEYRTMEPPGPLGRTASAGCAVAPTEILATAINRSLSAPGGDRPGARCPRRRVRRAHLAQRRNGSGVARARAAHPTTSTRFQLILRIDPNGVEHTSPGQRPGYGLSQSVALKGRDITAWLPMSRPFRARPNKQRYPRALPWAGISRPFGA